ncbi:hypothetical protein HJD18_10430 [Thermoleophilia bacterium SCSIO 60948]|nr:hypothetical protein HJD18_10430 [Thermoleophilia bacterium SCSIO 60948]
MTEQLTSKISQLDARLAALPIEMDTHREAFLDATAQHLAWYYSDAARVAAENQEVETLRMMKDTGKLSELKAEVAALAERAGPLTRRKLVDEQTDHFWPQDWTPDEIERLDHTARHRFERDWDPSHIAGDNAQAKALVSPLQELFGLVGEVLASYGLTAPNVDRLRSGSYAAWRELEWSEGMVQSMVEYRAVFHQYLADMNERGRLSEDLRRQQATSLWDEA